MKLYHYAPIKNTILTEGIFSFAQGAGDIKPYIRRAKSEKRAEIIRWMEMSFPGRSRAISCITEPIVWQGNDPMLYQFVKERTLFSIDLDRLVADRLIEAVWCQEGQGTAPDQNRFYQVSPEKIDFSPLPWHLCNRDKGLFFGVIRHYFVITKNGHIPPGYLSQK